MDLKTGPRRPGAVRGGRIPGGLRRLAVVSLLLVAAPASAQTYRDEILFFSKARILLKDFFIVIPIDFKRQTLPGQVFLEIKAWGGRNGTWVPYIYEPIDVEGANAFDLNDLVARYQRQTGQDRLQLKKGPDNAFELRYRKEGFRFDLQTGPLPIRLTLENPEGRHDFGADEARVSVGGRDLQGRLVYEFLSPPKAATASAPFGRYDHFTLLLPGGEFLILYHSDAPGYTACLLLGMQPRQDRRGDKVSLRWADLKRDPESGRDIPTRWTFAVEDLGIRGELKSWGENLSHGEAVKGRKAVYGNIMVQGWIEARGQRHWVFGLDAHIQDD